MKTASIIRGSRYRIRLLLFMAGGLVLLFFLLNLLFPFRPQPEYSTVITDDQDAVIHAYLTSDDKWRMKTGLAEISPLLKKTIIAKEDRYFYYHPGINPFSLARSAVKNILRGRRTSGASTITMQVARMLEPKRRTYLNKLIEMFRALQLELNYSKDEILQLYLNRVPYGGNIEGVKSAALLYLKKSPDHLSLAEITALSIIPNRPSSLVPGKHNDRITAERNRWLRKFARDGIFSEKEIRDALEEPFDAIRGNVPRYAPHLSNRLKAAGGNLIRTAVHLNTQLKTEKLVADYSRALALKNIRNAAVVIIDNATRKVITYVGSADFNDTLDAGQVDGVRAVRQPGSTLKPLLYALCIDEGLMTPKQVITDVPVNYSGYTPENYDRRFNGYVTMEYALEHSLNIPAVKSLRMYGPEKFIRKLADCRFEQIRKDQRKLGLSLILGGCGATLEELTGLYTAFAREGEYVKPSFLQDESAAPQERSAPQERVVSQERVISQDDGNVPPAGGGASPRGVSSQKGDVFLAGSGASPVRLTSPAAAFMVSEILSRVNRPDFPLSWGASEKLPRIAWKTGTSYGRRDAWSIGYNKRFTVGVWVGNFSGKGVPELSGANVATPLLFRIFNTVDYDSDQEWFRRPDDCEMRMVCPETGLPPAYHCPGVVMDYFIPLTSSARKCDNIREVIVSADETISYCRTCMPVNGYKKKKFRVISPEMQRFYDTRNLAYDKIPPHNPACEKIFTEGRPVITFPQAGAEYLISKKDPEPLQLTCNTGNDVSRVYWYINDRFYKSSDAGVKQFFMPPEGPVKISCTDDKGRNKDIQIRVRFY